jgi:hypothetical protein
VNAVIYSLDLYSCNVAGVCYLRYGTVEAISRMQYYIVPTQTQQTCVQRLSPENKGVSPYKQVTEAKSKA